MTEPRFYALRVGLQWCLHERLMPSKSQEVACITGAAAEGCVKRVAREWNGDDDQQRHNELGPTAAGLPAGGVRGEAVDL